jgi:hypothetical protein
MRDVEMTLLRLLEYAESRIRWHNLGDIRNDGAIVTSRMRGNDVVLIVGDAVIPCKCKRDVDRALYVVRQSIAHVMEGMK